MRKKSQIWVSAILYTLVAAVALVLILEAGVPILDRMKDRTTFTKTKDMMLNLDNHIREVASEGEGAQRVVPIEIKDGKMTISANQILWEMTTDNKIIDTHTSQKIGNLIITSNSNVQTLETSEYYRMNTTIQDDVFEVQINKTCCKNSWSEIDTSKLISYVSYNGVKINGTFNFSINNISDSTYGTGYTELVPSGNNTNLGWAKIIVHVNSSNGFGEYDLEIKLDSYSDFIRTKIKNFVPG